MQTAAKTRKKRKLDAVADFLHVSKRAHTIGDHTSRSGTSTDIRPAIPSSSAPEHDTTSRASMSEIAPPTSNPTVSTGEQPDNGRSTVDKVMTPAEKAWNSFKAILPIVEKVSVVFPPLQSAVGGLIGIISKFDTCKANTEKVEALAQTLDQLQRILVAYPEMMKEKQVRQLEYIQSVFEEAQAVVKTQSGKPCFARLIQGTDDQSKLVDSMGKLTRFVNLLELEVLGQTGVSVKEMHRDIKYEDLLKRLNHIVNASFMGAELDIQTRVECTPGTRTQVLDMLIAWTLDPEGTPFFWLNGMAGTGKSTIAQSICNRLNADGRLAASFFCSRSAGGGRNDARQIAPTIAFQLAHHVQGFMQQVCEVLRTPDVTTQSIEKQLQQLLWEPLDNAFMAPEASWNEIPLIVVIDGLDECSDAGAQQLVQSLLRRFEHDLPVHLRFLLFSRSERHIGIPINASTADVSRFELHEVPQSDVSRDIRRYVEAGMKEMSSRWDWGTMWYTEDDVHFIVVQADVLFIYAATVLKYLGDSKIRPEKRLHVLRQLEFTAKTIKTSALRPLHLLYNTILENLGEADDLEDFEVDLIRNILFILSQSPTPLSIPAIADLLDINRDEVRVCIGLLSSVVRVPLESEEDSGVVTTLHASFPEFLRSSSQLLPEHLRFDIGELHCLFLIRCLAVMNERLREGLLGTRANIWTSCRNVGEGELSTFISPVLAYAAQHWQFHAIEADLSDSISLNAVYASTVIFVNLHLLHWLECVAWTKAVDTVRNYLTKLCASDNMLLSSSPEVGHAFSDISHLINLESDAFEEFPCEIYRSALVLLPKTLCATLSSERKRRSLPTVELGLPDWSVKRYGSLHPSNQVIILDSLVVFEEKSSATWLSISKGNEVVAHEWNTIKGLENQQSLGRLANNRVIPKVASNGVFFLDPKEKTMSLKPLGPSTLSRPKPLKTVWNLPDVEILQSDQFGGLAISANGKYAALWGQDRFWMLLVDVSYDVYRWVPLMKISNPNAFPILKVCFSPDETRLAVLSSEMSLGSPGIQVFDTTDNRVRLSHCSSYLSPGTHFYFSTDSNIPLLLSRLNWTSEPNVLWQYNTETGEMISNQPVEDTSPRVPYFDGKLNNHFADGIGIGVKNSQRFIFYGNEELCKLPVNLQWEELAQVGGTHLLLSCARYGMIILKMPLVGPGPL